MLRRLRRHSAHLFQALARRRRRTPVEAELTSPIVIRYSRDDDQVALERLATLDSRALPEGPFLLALVDGEPVAAAPLDLDAEPLSDPFLPTANVRELLKLRARHVRRSRGAPARTVGAAPQTFPRFAETANGLTASGSSTE